MVLYGVYAAAELVSLGSVLPFLAVLTEPEQLWKAPWIQQLAPKLGWSSASELLGPAAGVFAVAAVTAALVRLANLWLGGQLAAAIGSDLSCKAYRNLLYQPYSFHINSSTNASISNITTQTTLTVAAVNGLLHSLTSLFVVAFVVLGLLLYKWKLAVFLSTSFSLSYLFFANAFKGELRSNSLRMRDLNVLQLKNLNEGLGSIRDISLDNTHNFFLKEYSA